jgi:hypothetical protein
MMDERILACSGGTGRTEPLKRLPDQLHPEIV